MGCKTPPLTIGLVMERLPYNIIIKISLVHHELYIKNVQYKVFFLKVSFCATCFMS